MKLSNTLIMEKTLMPSNKKAFTLAEVLITLSILGVVAALTIPSLVNRQNEMAAIVKLKKAISTYESIAEVYMAENEAVNLTGMLKTNAGDANGNCDNVANYFKVVAESSAAADAKCIFTTADGVVWSINKNTGYVSIVDSVKAPRYGVVMWTEGGLANSEQTEGVNGNTRPDVNKVATTPVGVTITGNTVGAPEHGFFAPENMLNMKQQANKDAANAVNGGATPVAATGVTWK
ncbi:type II secretion system protein [bacterium]|nr:type II secretion system protein [bacterium]